MSGFLVVAVWIVLLTGAGSFVTWPLARGAGLSRATAIAAGWLTGQLALGFTARLLSWMDLAWTPFRLLAGVLLLSAVGGVMARRVATAAAAPLPAGQRRPGTWVGIALIIALVLATLSVTIRQVRSPLWSNDAIAIWAMKAKVFAAEAGVDSASLADPGYDFSHPEYPLLWPVTMAAPMVGRDFDDLALTLFAPFFTLLLLAALLGELRRHGLDPPEVAAMGLLFLSFEGLLGPFHVGLAELPLAVAMLVTGVAVARLREHGDAAAAPLLAIALCAAVLLKNEGMVLPLAAAVILFWPGKRPAMRLLAGALAPPVLLLAASLLSRWMAGFSLHGDLQLRWLGPVELVTRLGTVAQFTFEHLIRPHALVAVVLVVVLFLGLRSGGNPGALGAFLLLVVLAYLPAYLWTRRYLTWHLETTLTRIAAPLGALLLLLAGGQLAAWLRELRPSSSTKWAARSGG